METLNLTQEWDKKFPQSNKVNHRKVTFRNRYGITLAADLYEPKNAEGKLAAIAVSGPFGAVKEQASGLYAQTMAERGFLTLAFDPSYTGESGGEPRNTASPDINTEDFSAAVDFLAALPNVDAERIGIIGICGFGGMGLNAAAMDTRIKATVASTMYDMSRVNHYGWEDSMSKEEYDKMLDRLGEQRWEDFENGEPQYIPSFPEEVTDSVPAGLDPISAEFWEYYAMERGHNPRARGGFTTTSNMAFINFPLMNYIETISPRPILFIIGENAHSRYFSEDAYRRAAEPKELYIVPGARHIDLYDRTDMIPFDKIESFFREYLK